LFCFSRGFRESLEAALSDGISHVFYNCISALWEHRQVEGLFRLPGAANAVKEFSAAFDNSKDPDLTKAEVHDVGSLCKVRHLSPPFPPFQLDSCS
jgi:hypothetical protein